MKVQVDEQDIIARCLDTLISSGRQDLAEQSGVAYIATYIHFCIEEGKEKAYLEHLCKSVMKLNEILGDFDND